MDTRLTSTTLLSALRMRDSDAWARFVTTYGQLIHFWVRRLGLSDHDVEDVAQEVFIAAAESFDSYTHSQTKSGSLRAWLYGIARNKTADWFRRHPLQHRAKGGSFANLKHLHQPMLPRDEAPETRTDQHLVVQALRLLETDFAPRTWQAFWRTAILSEKTKDVAGDLRMSTKAVRQARYRVLRHLRIELGADLPVAESSIA